MRICLATTLSGTLACVPDDAQTGSDYRENSRLDNYSEADLDERQFSELSMADRAAVEQALNRRDRARAIAEGRIPAAFLGGTLFFLRDSNLCVA